MSTMLSVRGLRLGWDDVTLIDDVTFDVARGEVVAILGGSGSGSHAARVDLRAVLRTRVRVLFDVDVQAVDEVGGASFDDVVAAFGRALDKASRDLSRRTGSALTADTGAKPGT
jgi:ABC-type transporter Mla maintaining outer membrane lipid asymmetry ATPase subunit MlaF